MKKLKELTYHLFVKPYEELEKEIIEELESDAYSYFDNEEKVISKKLRRGCLLLAAAGSVAGGYLSVSAADPLGCIGSFLLSLIGFCLYKHFGYIEKRAKLAKTFLLNSSEKKKDVLEEIEKYSKRGRRTHLIAAFAVPGILFLINPLFSVTASPFIGIWLRHIYKSYKTVYYTPLEWLRKRLKE